jgi:thiol-disulfide isomerase/thioredoxin
LPPAIGGGYASSGGAVSARVSPFEVFMSILRTRVALLRAGSALLLGAVLAGAALPALAFQFAVAEPEASGPLTVPELPEGTPEELLAFVEGLLPPKQRPSSREEMIEYIRGVSRVAVQAADKVLAQVEADSPLRVSASKLKLESLGALSQLGEDGAEDEMKAFADSLAASPIKELALEAKRMQLISEAREIFSSGRFDAAGGLVQKTAALMQENPDDQQTAALAMQLAGVLEQVPGGSELAVTAMKTFGPIMAASGDPRIQQLAESFDGKLRLMALPGNPMELKGDLLDGTAFNQAAFAGKVVLVDFWATWCGPCIAEIPNMKAEYDKYHAEGFEVVGISLDEDKAEVEKFVADNEIPWPIIFAGKGWQDPIAQFYGISGIPQLVLIGRDGNVITLDVRGEKLGEKLAELFKDAG